MLVRLHSSLFGLNASPVTRGVVYAHEGGHVGHDETVNIGGDDFAPGEPRSYAAEWLLARRRGGRDRQRYLMGLLSPHVNSNTRPEVAQEFTRTAVIGLTLLAVVDGDTRVLGSLRAAGVPEAFLSARPDAAADLFADLATEPSLPAELLAYDAWLGQSASDASSLRLRAQDVFDSVQRSGELAQENGGSSSTNQ